MSWKNLMHLRSITEKEGRVVAEPDDEWCDDPYPLNTLENFLDEWNIRGQIERQLVSKAWYRAVESVSPQPLPDDKPMPRITKQDAREIISAYIDSKIGEPVDKWLEPLLNKLNADRE